VEFDVAFSVPFTHTKFHSYHRTHLLPYRLSQSPRYHPVLIQFMSYRDDEEYERDHDFTPEELNEIQPEEIEKWMCVKVYGIPEPGPDDNPTLGRASLLDYYKKALSYYMPNKLFGWNAISKKGKPTRSIPVNELIKRVK
jgi:hypothetical protein